MIMMFELGFKPMKSKANVAALGAAKCLQIAGDLQMTARSCLTGAV